MLRFLFVFSVPTFSSYNPDIAKKGASSGGVTPLRWRARGPNQGGGGPHQGSMMVMGFAPTPMQNENTEDTEDTGGLR